LVNFSRLVGVRTAGTDELTSKICIAAY